MQRVRTRLLASLLLIAGLFLTTVACGALLAPAPTPVPTPLPTETAIPLYQQVTLNAVSGEEADPLGTYSIKTQTPALVGSDDPRVNNFNAEMVALVEKAVGDFKQNVANLPPSPSSTVSTLDVHFNQLSPPGNIISLKFDMQSFYTGAAHPGDTSLTANYDLQAGQDVDLADLFQPDADYLGVISKYCVDQLKTRDISFQDFELGATPTTDNYRNWNITADGLLITFDEYQVAPYAAGPQIVVIPYKQLAQIIQPDGPLASYLH